MATENYIIDKVSWHTSVTGNPESEIHIKNRFWVIIDFLQKNNLTNTIIIKSANDVGDDFEISTSMLTFDGYALMKKSYDKWLSKVDKGMKAENTSIFENELYNLRNQK